MLFKLYRAFELTRDLVTMKILIQQVWSGAKDSRFLVSSELMLLGSGFNEKNMENPSSPATKYKIDDRSREDQPDYMNTI